MPIDRPKEPPKFDDIDFGDAFPSETPPAPGEDDAVTDDRPTVSPPFDPAEYAKASEAKVRTARATPSPLSYPEPGDASTKPPPPDFDFSDPLPAALSLRPRAPQITLTDEAELEQARINSVLMPSEPPRPKGTMRPAAPGDPFEEREEVAPPTVAYPVEFEKDPFSRLSDPGPEYSSAAKQLRDMRDKFSLGDYTGALEAAEAVFERDPANTEAFACAEDSRAKLQQMYAARIGPMDRVPMVLVAREQLRWLSIDHRAGFLLSHIDGVSSLEMILDVSGMPLFDALKILCELQQQRVISFR